MAELPASPSKLFDKGKGPELAATSTTPPTFSEDASYISGYNEALQDIYFQQSLLVLRTTPYPNHICHETPPPTFPAGPQSFTTISIKPINCPYRPTRVLPPLFPSPLGEGAENLDDDDEALLVLIKVLRGFLEKRDEVEATDYEAWGESVGTLFPQFKKGARRLGRIIFYAERRGEEVDVEKIFEAEEERIAGTMAEVVKARIARLTGVIEEVEGLEEKLKERWESLDEYLSEVGHRFIAEGRREKYEKRDREVEMIRGSF